jgi:fused signal recognition particle receptor
MAVSFLEKVRKGLARTRSTLVDGIKATVSGGATIDDTALDDLEALLIQADVGVTTASRIIDSLRERLATKEGGADAMTELFDVLEAELRAVLVQTEAPPLDPSAKFEVQPFVILVVGVNGVGKTTTIGKLAHQYSQAGHRVMVAACDTFRAAAVDQLEVWANRAGADIVRSQSGADPAAVAFDAVAAAKARQIDILFVDTAGRLHTKVNLMEELKKVRRSLGKEGGTAPHETLLVLDATTGQNALNQARQFHEATQVSGLVLTKLDGSAKGGIVFALGRELEIPIRFIGVGEGIDDLQPFDGQAFVQALLDR